jgi:mannitol 2-dehydrogenase
MVIKKLKITKKNIKAIEFIAVVDRITPATTDVERHRCVQEFGIADNSPVFCEPFRQWILEDNFPAGRPPLELVGAKFVPDVSPYENIKIRILNGGHILLAHLGPLLGVTHVHDFMAHPLARAFWRKVELEEILPGVQAIVAASGIDLDPLEFVSQIEQRFANPRVADPVLRLSTSGTTRVPNFINPTLRGNE